MRPFLRLVKVEGERVVNNMVSAGTITMKIMSLGKVLTSV